jgi:hypothetical protein
MFMIIGAFYRVEKREDGYYFRSVVNVYTSWRGPYLNYGEVAEEMADDLQEEMERAPLL